MKLFLRESQVHTIKMEILMISCKAKLILWQLFSLSQVSPWNFWRTYLQTFSHPLKILGSIPYCACQTTQNYGKGIYTFVNFQPPNVNKPSLGWFPLQRIISRLLQAWSEDSYSRFALKHNYYCKFSEPTCSIKLWAIFRTTLHFFFSFFLTWLFSPFIILKWRWFNGN